MNIADNIEKLKQLSRATERYRTPKAGTR